MYSVESLHCGEGGMEDSGVSSRARAVKRSQGHPEEDLLEQYSLGRVAGSDLRALEEHLLLCPQCQDRLTEVDAYVRAMQDGAKRLTDVRISLTHQTPDGPVHVHVIRSSRGKWIARLRGRELDLMREFPRVEEATECALQSFADLFPQHHCTCSCAAKKPARMPEG